jgi:hypothetical protein
MPKRRKSNAFLKYLRVSTLSTYCKLGAILPSGDKSRGGYVLGMLYSLGHVTLIHLNLSVISTGDHAIFLDGCFWGRIFAQGTVSLVHSSNLRHWQGQWRMFYM